ncbi:MAG: PTS sugar transporter subunit IIA [bacterium]
MATLEQSASVSISELLSEDVIEPDLEAESREEVFEELIGCLVDNGELESSENALKALHDREEILSTGIGEGLAIPHAKMEELDNFLAAFARIPDGVDFKSLDGKPAHLIFLLLSPKGEAGRHVRVLARVSRMLKNVHFRDRLLEAESADKILDLIAEADEEQN